MEIGKYVQTTYNKLFSEGKFMRKIVLLLFLVIIAFPPHLSVLAEAAESNRSSQLHERKALFEKMESILGIPWYFLAAIDQYERSIQAVRKDTPKRDGMIAIQFPGEKWAGFLNPDHGDDQITSIQFFNGMGKDGSGDGLADPHDDFDVLYTMAYYIAQHGFTNNDIRIALWEYYGQDKIVRTIAHFAKIYQTANTLEINENAFPISRWSHYSYQNNWGAARGWGGRRSHEGTDIFASYGTTVVSTCYGYIETLGWNRFGGWRIGIRDINNVYHYFAHLSGFNKDIKIGDIVKPGQVIGSVGSSGYGKKGTQGKFPPHLHYGMYKFNGKTEWAFDPYPHLKKWERQTRKKK